VEPKLLAGLLVLGALLLGLAKIIEDVVNRESGSFDRHILMALRAAGDASAPIGPAWLGQSAIDITGLGSPTLITIVTVISVAYLALVARYWLSLLVGVSVGLGAILETSLKLAFDRARPDIVPHLVPVHSLSFPSGHAMLSAFTYLTLGALLARAEEQPRVWLFILLVSLTVTLLIGASRVYLGVHWPTDVLVGWTVGAAWALLTWMLAEILSARWASPN
jgi:undecaprenyl-diphosphatase